MSDTCLLECIYEQLKSIENKQIRYEEASKIIETAFIALNKTIKTPKNSEYLKKTDKLFNKIYMQFAPSCDEGLEDLMECSSSQVSKILQGVY